MLQYETNQNITLYLHNDNYAKSLSICRKKRTLEGRECKNDNSYVVKYDYKKHFFFASFLC